MQWAIRMLLPRPNGTPAPQIPATAAAAAAGLAGSAAAEPNAGPAAALALLAEHAQQAQVLRLLPAAPALQPNLMRTPGTPLERPVRIYANMQLVCMHLHSESGV